MKNRIYFFIYLLSAGFGFNTDFLATNLINLSVVLGALIFFVKGVLNDLLDNRNKRILNPIRNSEKLRIEAIEQLEKDRANLQKVKMEIDRFRVNRYSEIEQEKSNWINSIYITFEKLENYKNQTILFEQQRAINQVQQWLFQQAFQGSLGTLKSCLDNELHLRTISANINIFGMIKERMD